MRTKVIITVGALLVLALSACGDDSLDGQAASQVMMEARGAGTTTYANVWEGVGKLDGAWVSGSADSFQVSGEVTGPQGGSAAVTGSGSTAAGTAFKMDLTMQFTDWKSNQGLVLNGAINLRYDVKSVAPTINYTMKYSGDLEVSGSASGTATFDLTISISGFGSYKVCGTVSGHDVSDPARKLLDPCRPTIPSSSV